MYVRIAQFDGAPEDVDERVSEIRSRMQTDEMGLRQHVARSMMLIDRETGKGASLMLCESQEDLRRVDEIMNAASPPAGSSLQRTSVQMYEVAIDSEESR